MPRQQVECVFSKKSSYFRDRI